MPGLREFGFWEYTNANNESLCRYADRDWDVLLDDMAAGGMNSLVVMVKQYVTGYRSALPWLDQPMDNPVVAQDNRPVHRAIAEAHRRGIRVWLGAVCNMFQVPPFDLVPCLGKTVGSMGVYDQDQPGLAERMTAVMAELARLFPAADGLIVEVENVDRMPRHRVTLFDQWAGAEGEPSFAEVTAGPIDVRWQKGMTVIRRFLTDRRAWLCRLIESAVRAEGFAGQLALITECGSHEGSYLCSTLYARLKEKLPGWAVVTYDYDRYRNRYAGTEFCLVGPMQAGLAVYYLPRGLLTWKGHLPIPLEAHWRLDIEDALAHPPTGLWWFGADALGERAGSGSYCSREEVRRHGFADGLEARRRLIRLCRESGLGLAR